MYRPVTPQQLLGGVRGEQKHCTELSGVKGEGARGTAKTAVVAA